ncbi:bifunctional helix-turn-helix transcriptional regulator/GNAT family N-acetyltransferase [Arenibacterium sp. CAU 1754]
MDNPEQDPIISQVRAFNRFHTQWVGALNDHMLASDYGLPQVRVLYEIANPPADGPPSASALARALQMDTGYLSRIVAGLESAGLIARTPSPGNAKRLSLSLTEAGREIFAGLNRSSAEEIAARLKPLDATERRQLTGAMARVRRLLGDTPPKPTFILRDPEVGDLGHVVQRQSDLYAQEYGWNWEFEALLCEIMAQFIRSFDPDRERAWIAEQEGDIVGSVFVVREDDSTAKLRMLYVEPDARGMGLGRSLVQECLRFARTRGYTRMVLWTNDILTSARHIYETTGFRLIGEDPHHSFGKDLVGQNWALDL